MIIPTAGDVLIDGEKLDPKRQNISFMPQNYGLFPWQTVEENILLPFRIKHISPNRQRIDETMTDLHIDGLGKRYPHEISGGQQQRVALARAFLAELIIMYKKNTNMAIKNITENCTLPNMFFKDILSLNLYINCPFARYCA